MYGRDRDARGADAAYCWVVERHQDGWPHVHVLLGLGGWERLVREQWTAFIALVRVQWGRTIGSCDFPQEAWMEFGEIAPDGAPYAPLYPYRWIPDGAPNCRWDVVEEGDTENASAYLEEYLSKPEDYSGIHKQLEDIEDRGRARVLAQIAEWDMWLTIATWTYRRRRRGGSVRRARVPRERQWERVKMIAARDGRALASRAREAGTIEWESEWGAGWTVTDMGAPAWLVAMEPEKVWREDDDGGGWSAVTIPCREESQKAQGKSRKSHGSEPLSIEADRKKWGLPQGNPRFIEKERVRLEAARQKSLSSTLGRQ